MLMPKKVKYRKQQRGRRAGKAWRGGTLAFGEYGLKAMEPAWITDRQIEAARVAITRFIIDSISNMISRHRALPSEFWWLVLLEFGLACAGMILGRMVDYCDAVFADKYATYINTRIMEHASRLDLATYEDPHFHDVGAMLEAIGEAVEFPPGFPPESKLVIALRGQDALLEIFHRTI